MQWHSDPDLGPLAEVWQAAAASGAGSVFQSYAFARQWARCYAGEAELRIGWQATPPLIVPLAVRRGRLELMGEGLFDYLDLIGRAEANGQGEAAERARGWGCAAAQFTGVGAGTRFGVFWQGLGAEARPYAAAPVRAAGARLEGEHRRLEARWRRAQPTLRLETEAGARRHLLAWLLDHKARGLAGRGERNVLGAREQNWLAAMVEGEPELSELWALERGGRRLSALLAWQSRDARYGYTISYEEEAAELSPGILLLFAVVRHTMNEGRSFHFLTGEQAYKRRFATHGAALLRYMVGAGPSAPAARVPLVLAPTWGPGGPKSELRLAGAAPYSLPGGGPPCGITTTPEPEAGSGDPGSQPFAPILPAGKAARPPRVEEPR